VSSDGVRIHYETEGKGPTIIMRTGSGGDIRIWREAGYVAGLTGFQKILIDQRGRGMSDSPTTVESHRFERHVEDICAVLDDAGVEAAAFIGYSAGATMGVAFGAAHPNRLRALVGIGSLPCINYSDRPKPESIDAEIKRIVAAGGVRAEYEGAREDEGSPFPEAIEKNVLEGDPLMRALDGVAALEWHGPLALYPDIKVPVLMVAGEREDTDRVTEKSISKITNARLIRLPGLAHLSAFYRSDITLQQLIPFLRKNLQEHG
jgi:pimeloyl-ACP methyl ester carboxylesterase